MRSFSLVEILLLILCFFKATETTMQVNDGTTENVKQIGKFLNSPLFTFTFLLYVKDTNE